MTNTTARTPGTLYVRTNRHRSTNGQPWGWIDRSPGPQQVSIDGLRIEWNGEQGHANAAFIVRAANSFDELVAVLDWYRERAESLAKRDWRKNPDYALAIMTELSLDAGNRARAALAKARQP
mgnify:CR=1 FL=1